MLSAPALERTQPIIAARPTVLCLHSSTSSARQWQELAGLLEDRYEVAAVDLLGYGKADEWHGARKLTLDDEVDRLRDIFERAVGRVHLVGHSYGGAVAARAAVRYAHRVASVTLYEPVLFRFLADDDDSRGAKAEIEAVDRKVRAEIEQGRPEAAAEHFIDYWSGHGSWQSLPEWRRDGLARKMAKVVSDFDAVLDSDYDLDQFRRLSIPVLLLYGLRSPQASRRVVARLAEAVPDAEVRGLLGLGHMGPVTHAAQVNPLIERYLDRVDARERGGHTVRQRVA